FQSTVASSVIHSFPTRRSSDLSRMFWFREITMTVGRASRLIALGWMVAVCGAEDAFAQQPGEMETTGQLEEVVVTATKRASTVQDRKSTRLNSSHLGISYAVFC